MKILNDFQTTVRKALEEIDPNYESYDGLVVCGTHRPELVEQMINEIYNARVKGTPFLGICFGHQLAAIEYARNVLKQPGATSEELFDPRNKEYINNLQIPPQFIVIKRPGGLKVGLHDRESWWNNYEVLPDFEKMWKKPPHFITCQFHPEYQSSKDKPHPLLVQFMNLCKK